MLVSFNPLSDEQLEELNRPFEPGMANFEIIKAENKQSQSGNNMIVVEMRAWDKNGTERKIKDHLVLTDRAMFKLKNFCEAIGLLSSYQKGTINTYELVGKRGKAAIKEEDGTNSDGVPTKFLKVSGYIVDEAKQFISNKYSQKSNDELNDDVPW